MKSTRERKKMKAEKQIDMFDFLFSLASCSSFNSVHCTAEEKRDSTEVINIEYGIDSDDGRHLHHIHYAFYAGGNEHFSNDSHEFFIFFCVFSWNINVDIEASFLWAFISVCLHRHWCDVRVATKSLASHRQFNLTLRFIQITFLVSFNGSD